MDDVYNEQSLAKLLDLDEDKKETSKEKNEKFREMFPSENDEETYKERYGDDVNVKIAKQMEDDEIFNNDIKKILKREGGYHDGTGDHGGPTNYGISQNAYPDEDIKNVTPERAKYLYYRDYCIKPRICELADNFRGDVMDNAINQGPYQAAKNLQRTIGAKVDGYIGPETIKKANKMFNQDSENTKRRFQNNVADIYNKICKKDPKYCEDKKAGWDNRYNNGF